MGVCSPYSLPRLETRNFSRTAGLGVCQMLEVLGRGGSMRLPTSLWLVFRLHGRAQLTSQDAFGGCGLVKGSRQLHSGLLLHGAPAFGSLPHWEISNGRTKLRTCRAASSGRGGDAQFGSNDEDFGGSLLKTVQALPQLNWPGFRRFSQDVRWEKQVDEGDWKYSPEWWGTQAGGWGHNHGETVFEAPSIAGNGVVSVTSHPASTPNLQAAQKQSQHEVLGYEWRVLRFNSVTRQSVAKVQALATGVGDVILQQQPNCIAFEYVKSMISAGLSAVSLSGLDLQRVHSGYEKIRILCIGLGGGSLPLFLAHNLPGAIVEAVEIDATVILAAVETMGFPPSTGTATKDQSKIWGDMLQRVILHEKDGEAFVCEQARKVSTGNTKLEYDLVFVDAYDGEDVVPLKLWDRSGPFLSSLGSLLNSDHGTVVVNLHTDSAPPSILERISGKFGPGFDPTLPQGKRVQEAALAYRDVLLTGSDSGQGQIDNRDATRTDVSGLAFTVAVSLQGNISLVVSRLSSAKADVYKAFTQRANEEEALIRTFVSEAERVQRILNVPFEMSKRVQRGFQFVKS
ncbi:unnamed protein product [Calypogeia fissa]